MTVAELIAVLSKIEDQTIDVCYLSSEYGDQDLDFAELVTERRLGAFGPPTPYVRLW